MNAAVELGTMLIIRNSGLAGGERTIRPVNAYQPPPTGEKSRMYRHLLIPVDGSDASKAGLREVVRIVTPEVSKLRLVHVIDSSVGKDSCDPGTVGDTMVQASRDEGTAILAEARVALAKYDIHAECVLIESHGERVASRIIAQAREWPADLIVMGSHGRRGLARIAMGSQAAEVFRDSPVPVLLIRAVYP
jgi:nucleotide-binding universal stress UspA family protein